MSFQDDYQAAQLEIDLRTIEADDREEMLTWDSVDTSVEDDFHQPFGFSVEPYANFSEARIVALAEKHGLTGTAYLDKIADMRDQILQCRKV